MISVVIPTFNRAHLISRAIKSIQDQTFRDWELLIVDDGSIDNTVQVISEFSDDHRIRYIGKENSGAAHSRNVGVEQASNEWITFLDSDDEARPDWLQKFVDEINSGAQIVSCGLEKYNEKGEHISTKIPTQNAHRTGGQFTNGGVYILKKEHFLAIGGFDPLLRSGQHTELYFRLRKYAAERNIVTTVIPLPLIKIHIHTGYRIRSDHKAKFEGSMYTYRKHFNDAIKPKKMRSLFEGLIAYNAFKIGKYDTAVAFGWKSFINKPGKKSFQRLLRYVFRIR